MQLKHYVCKACFFRREAPPGQGAVAGTSAVAEALPVDPMKTPLQSVEEIETEESLGESALPHPPALQMPADARQARLTPLIPASNRHEPEIPITGISTTPITMQPTAAPM